MEQIEVALNDQSPMRFRKWEQFSKFLDKEMATWAWLAPALHSCNFGNSGNAVTQQFSSLLELANARGNGGPITYAQSPLVTAYRESGPLFYSDTREGEAILRARAVAGDRAGAFAYSVYAGGGQLGHAAVRADIIGLVIAAFPDLGPIPELADRLATERSNYKSALNRQIESFGDQIDKQERQREDLLARAHSGARKMFRRRIRLWNLQQKNRDEASQAAVDNLTSTEKAYKEFMQLRAAVDYWNTESSRHTTEKSTALRRLLIFFPSAVILTIISFAVGAAIILNVESVNRPAIQVIVAGVIIALSTILFWIGRILTKLFLSEHHLEHDAKQRAVMTSTYLALINENAATDLDRTIILGALFRSTPDGIVKEEGPGDPSGLAGTLSKFGVGR